MQRNNLIAAGVLALGAICPAAEAAEFRALLGGWGYHFAGNVNDRGTRYDFEDQLELVPRGRRSASLEFDTPRGWWPNIAASYTQLGADGDHVETVTVGPVTTTRTISTDADFDGWDVVARYPFRLGPLRAAAGLGVQQLRGDILIEDSEDSAPRREHYDEVFPQLHAQLRWRLGPMVLMATGQGVEYDGSRALEWRAGAEFRFLEPLLLEVGFQEKRYEIELADYALDARVRGALVRVGFLIR